MPARCEVDKVVLMPIPKRIRDCRLAFRSGRLDRGAATRRHSLAESAGFAITTGYIPCLALFYNIGAVKQPFKDVKVRQP